MINRLHNYVTTLSDKDRLSFIRSIVCIGLICGLLISYNLWINNRFYPLLPVSDFIPVLATPFDSILFFAVITLIATVIFYPKKYFFGILLIAIIYLLLQDQSRLQPWFQQYLFLLGAVAWYKAKPDPQRAKAAIISIQIILIGIYLWSGIHKLNHTYIFDTFEWLTVPISDFIPTSSLPALAVISGLIEIGAGLMLAFRATRFYSIWVLISMHFFILLMVGPYGLEYNSVVWPWNIIFIFLLPISFLGTTGDTSYPKIYIPSSFYHGGVIIFFIFLPALNFLNFWDHLPSNSLYSGKKPYAILHVTDPVKGSTR